MANQSPIGKASVLKFRDGKAEKTDDLVVREEPLEIRLRFGQKDNRKEKALAVTMRTPGNDFELALGFLITEGIITVPGQVASVRYCLQTEPESEGNVVNVDLHPEVEWDPNSLERNFFANSSCGICGKASLENIGVRCEPVSADIRLSSEILLSLSARTRENQVVFSATGGLHAAAIFDKNGNLLMVREDVGRHNALDKLIGALISGSKNEISQGILFCSGRAGFEIVQKAAVAGFPFVACVGAPTDLAIRLAETQGLTLIGFLSKSGMNVYSHSERIQNPASD